MSGYAHLPIIRTTSKHSISVHLRVVLSRLYPTPIPQRPKNCKTQQSGTPHRRNITIQQKHTVLPTNQRWQNPQHNTQTNHPRMATSMHMPTNNLPMSSQTKAKYPMHTRSPSPNTNTHYTLPHPHNPIYGIQILPRSIPRTSPLTQTH